MTLEEATYVLTVEPGAPLPFAPRNRRQLNPYKIVDDVHGLLEYVSSSSRLMLAHSTIREYLLLDDVVRYYRLLRRGFAKSLIVRTRLGYLASVPPSRDRDWLIYTYPFVEYAARQWIKQAREVAWTNENSAPKCVDSSAGQRSKFFDRCYHQNSPGALSRIKSCHNQLLVYIWRHMQVW
jgi:hypothetical protein